MTLPKKPYMTMANLGGEDGYAELGSKFKASHVKVIIWWLAKESQKSADRYRNVTWLILL